jgi:peptidyl-prolyl cis-trans isomerase SurA
MRKAFPVLLLTSTIVLAPAFAADAVIEEIIARVNNQIVTRTELVRSRDEIRKEAMQQDPVNADKIIADKDKDVLRDLIDQSLLEEKAKDLGISGDTELVKRLDEMRKQMNLDSMEELEKAAQAQGVSFEDFKQNLRNQIVTQQVIGKEVGSRLTISKDDEKAFYEAHKDEFAIPEQIRLSEILISTDKKPGDTRDENQILDAAQAKANSVLEEIKKGGSFADIAKKESEGPGAADGGDLGTFKRGVLGPLEEKTFVMKAGDVSDVIRTKQGFIILKVTEHQEAGIPPLSQVEQHVQDQVYMKKVQPALREYLTRLREEAFIEIKPGYVDSGASPNQTKPVEVATKDDKAKPLKKKKKLGIF